MSRKLRYMTWKEVQEEMSIAGEPEKVTAIADEVLKLVMERLGETKNIPTYDNMVFGLRRVIAELELHRKWEYDRQHPIIK